MNSLNTFDFGIIMLITGFLAGCLFGAAIYILEGKAVKSK